MSGGAANFATARCGVITVHESAPVVKFIFWSSTYIGQKFAGRLAGFASQHAKIAAVIAQKLQNVVSDSLRALAQKQLLQKGENFALMRQRAAAVGIKVKPGHKKSRPF